jgi:hypothetical protein
MHKYDVKVLIFPKNTTDKEGSCRWDVGVGWYEGRIRNIEFPEQVSEGQEIDISLRNIRKPNYILSGLAKRVEKDHFVFLKEVTTKKEWSDIADRIGFDCKDHNSEVVFYGGG